ncbi:MAG TPA: hypothetical protein P5279_00575 [Anaerohalosphaeraceae bacterium]|jgi:hypothetical protein|nr:hypothetical protein [Anaerohalosphaeraceae bacterium]HRT48960.1 hypothetical protein [Anaerohalosphaeraceae bacterium]HRT85083.1 hypothetical protein [Anaerohalosphaeraceae bacterium]
MTRYEVEEMAGHVIEVEQLLDEWALDEEEMQVELAELQRMIRWLGKARCGGCRDKDILDFLPQLEERIQHCFQCIRERLRARW